MSQWLEATFSTHRPRAIAALTRYFRDVEIAEEAYAEACLKAVAHWRTNPVPRDPLAWILKVARNSGLDTVRKAQRQRTILAAHPIDMGESDKDAVLDPDEVRDDVLRLLFICCHPALAHPDQIALALRIVGGLTIEEIARGFLVKPKTMEQRLTRAKKKISVNQVAFETPSLSERANRLQEVSLMIYLMFNEGWSTSDSDTQIRLRVCEEAIRLARLLAELFPGMGEQVALVSLFLFQHARRGARQTDTGGLIALEDQDRTLWDRAAIAEAFAMLQKAERIGHSGAFRIQAAIAAEHARAKSADQTDWHTIEAHYGALYALQPSPVVRLNHIAALAKTRGAAFALTEMESLSGELARYRWFYTMRGGLLEQTGDYEKASVAYQTAMTLGPTEPERAIIAEKIAICEEKA